MVLLTVTSATKAAIKQYKETTSSTRSGNENNLDHLFTLEIGSPIEHEDLITFSAHLSQYGRKNGLDIERWRLDGLLKGAIVYQPPPPSKPEPTPQYKALMQRLRHEEEQRQYERMVNPQPQHEAFGQRFPNTGYTFNAATSIGQGPDAKEVDEVTFADVNRQMALIINVLVSIIACSVAIWIAARRWSVPQRLGLSMSGSCLVAVAEVAIYMGYIRRVKDAKDSEKKVVESKEIVESWILDGTASDQKKEAIDSIRFRKGKHR